jgi:DNA-directed RNA polymerase subunit RPC12/RpoP
MPVPEWAGEMGESMMDALGQQRDLGVAALSLEPVTDYSTFFAEWERRDTDILIHLFPRNGADDKWEDGHYLPICRECRYDMSREDAEQGKACPRCNHKGLVYVPGTREQQAAIAFPGTVKEHVEKAMDDAWLGDFALDLIPELGAVAVQVQDAALTDAALSQLLEKFFDSLDGRLDNGTA